MKASTALKREDLPESSSRRPSVLARIQATPPNFLWGSVVGLSSFLILMHFTIGSRWEQFLGCGIFLFVSLWSNQTRVFATLVLPLLLYGIAYDLGHLTSPLVRYLTVHVSEPYNFDIRYFGILTPTGVVTPSEYFATHNWPIVDFFTGVAYIIYLWWQIAFGIYLAATSKTPERIQLAKRFGWTFLALNLAAFATYYIYPAAPPWYAADHGFGPIDWTVKASPAGAARWDQLTGLNYFASFYSRSADIFGAIPSLHVAGPLAVAIYGTYLRRPWLNVANFGFWLLVAFAAVYLQHHYVLDVLLGALYALAAWGGQLLVSYVWRTAQSSDRPMQPNPTG
jgi:hypothetical protein